MHQPSTCVVRTEDVHALRYMQVRQPTLSFWSGRKSSEYAMWLLHSRHRAVWTPGSSWPIACVS